MNFTKVVNLL